jgi:hypothetical protein
VSAWITGVAAHLRPRDPIIEPPVTLAEAETLIVVAWTLVIVGATFIMIGLLARWWVFRTPVALTTSGLTAVVTILLWARLLGFV